MKIYRIENEQTKNGMWYRYDGTYDPFIKTLTEGKSKHLPMEWHKRYSEGNRKWFSGCNSLEQLESWFSEMDIKELYDNGYRLYEFESEQFIEEESRVIFTREGVISKKR